MKNLAPTLTLLALTLAAPVQAETTNCTAITALPYTITTQGVFCLTGHLATGMTSGSAITINANNVVLDLNGFKLGGIAAGKGTQANGIYAYQRQNVTVKNGIIRGFMSGISFQDVSPYTTSQGHVIEDIRADLNTVVGIQILGNGNMVRNNMVVATGGSTIQLSALGIHMMGPGARALNNDVTEVVAQSPGNATGILLESGSNGVVAGNRIGNLTSPSGSNYGIYMSVGSNIAIKDNILTGMLYGIYFSSATGKYMNNLTEGVTTPYTGGTDAAGSNF